MHNYHFEISIFMVDIIKNNIKRILSPFGYKIININTQKDIWEKDPNFSNIYQHIKDTTIVGPDRSFVLYQFARHARLIDGDIAEVGVYKGGTAELLAELFNNTNKTLYLFDTFCGTPSTIAPVDMHQEGDFSDVSLPTIKARLKKYSQIEFREGVFPETTVGLNDKRFCFVYLDADIYQETKDGLNFFYKRVLPGGVIVIDDYEGKHCPGVKQAIDEFGVQYDIQPIIFAKAQCILIKS
jgi:hypothetical protein